MFISFHDKYLLKCLRGVLRDGKVCLFLLHSARLMSVQNFLVKPFLCSFGAWCHLRPAPGSQVFHSSFRICISFLIWTVKNEAPPHRAHTPRWAFWGPFNLKVFFFLFFFFFKDAIFKKIFVNNINDNLFIYCHVLCHCFLLVLFLSVFIALLWMDVPFVIWSVI